MQTKVPGPKSLKVLSYLKRHNGGWGVPHPFVFAKEGAGCYLKDIDGNTFLDFASNVASTPLGYNHPDLKDVVRRYAKYAPLKIAGQDFAVAEHADLLEEVLSITPASMNAAFFVNSGAEAVENAMKLCMRKKKTTKFGISFESGFHGRTLGALSLTNSKTVQKKHFLSLPVKRLPFSDEAPEKLERMLREEGSSQDIGFVILEHVQGEGGYNVASRKMVRSIRELTKQHKIPFIADEVQSGLGRTGEWWAFEHFRIKPDVMSSAKALQVGATIANKDMFPQEPGAISSTWGGGHILDLAVGLQTIKTIKRRKLLSNITQQGKYVQKRVREVQGVTNIRGLGLMQAFDVPSSKVRDNIVMECAKQGLIVLGCGVKGIRLIPPFIVTRKEIDEAVTVLEAAMQKCCKHSFKHSGSICKFIDCGENVS